MSDFGVLLSLCLHRPPHFRGLGPAVSGALLCRRPDHLLRDLAVQAGSLIFSEGFFYKPVLTGMEGQNSSLSS